MTTPILPPLSSERPARLETFAVQRKTRALGQVNPAANTDTDAYTVPKRKQSEVTVFVAETSAVATTYRIALRGDGSAIATKHYVAFGVALAANTVASHGPFMLDDDDVVTVRAGTDNVAFTVTGWEEPKAP